MEYHANPSKGQRTLGGPKTVTLPDFLSESQLNQAILCGSAREVCERVIAPNLEEINRKLGQDNDPLYLAYACEHVFRQAGLWRDR